MRPVSRGEPPAGLSVSEYGQARPALIERLGDYCSFCEVKLPSPDVEHIRSKHHNPELELEWSNFLLACKSCNGTKGDQVSTEEDVDQRLWPHRDPTLQAFVYGAGGQVTVAAQGDPVQQEKAQRTADMVGLLKRPGAGLRREQQRTASDRRWKLRLEAWNEAISAKEDLQQCPTNQVRKLTLSLAISTGFFSVWYNVFRDDPEMLAGLRAAFPGTDADRLVLPG